MLFIYKYILIMYARIRIFFNGDGFYEHFWTYLILSFVIYNTLQVIVCIM